MDAEVNQNPIVYFDNRFVPLAEAKVSVPHAWHCNTAPAVFEGIRGYWNADEQEMFLGCGRGAFRALEGQLRHPANWRSNSAPIRLSEITPNSCGAIDSGRTSTCAHWHTNQAERVGLMPDDQNAISIIAMPYGAYFDSSRGLHAGVSSWRRIEDNAIPARGKISGAYVNSVLASDEARRNGFDEAIFPERERARMRRRFLQSIPGK